MRIEQHARSADWVARKAEVGCKCIGGAERNDAQSGFGARHGLQDFVDGSVAATGQNGVAAALDGLLRMQAGGVGGLSRNGFNLHSGRPEDLNDASDQRGAARGLFARGRVVD